MTDLIFLSLINVSADLLLISILFFNATSLGNIVNRSFLDAIYSNSFNVLLIVPSDIVDPNSLLKNVLRNRDVVDVIPNNSSNFSTL